MREMPPKPQHAVLVLIAGSTAAAFVPDPAIPSRYLRTDASVLYAACPSCGSARGIPCRGQVERGGRAFTCSAHTSRGDAAREAKAAGFELEARIGHGMRVKIDDIEPKRTPQQ